MPWIRYEKLLTKISANFRPEAETNDALSRKHVYTLFLRYQALKKKIGCWDAADLVSHIYSSLKKEKWTGPTIHSLSADEIQDFVSAPALSCLCCLWS